MRRVCAISLLCALLAGCAADDTAVTTSQPDPSTSAPGTAEPTTSNSTAPTTTTADAAQGVPEPAGAQGLGDPYFPELGNGGYDVSHYDIELSVDPATAELDATTTISATATESLATFNLDFIGLDISAITVDGSPAPFVREGHELRISPNTGIVAGEEFSVTVSYSGKPEQRRLVSVGVDTGWTQTPEGIYVAAEPDAARTWFPANDHPLDKATYSFLITVPPPLVAAANGELVEVIDRDAGRTYRWVLDSPMATYLATVVIGEYERIDSEGPDGVILRDYIPTSFDGAIPGAFEITAEAMELLSDWFGPYPFDRYGHIVVYQFGGALETQTLSLMGNRALFAEVTVHELAHQWFGDAVTPASWQDIWLNEGFATFAEFLWIEHRRGEEAMLTDIEDRHDNLRSIGHDPIADPGETQLFGPAVYWRGGMTLHALRTALDDDALMRDVLQTYFDRYRDGNATTADFIEVVHEVTDRDFTELWDAWLFEAELPELP